MNIKFQDRTADQNSVYCKKKKKEKKNTKLVCWTIKYNHRIFLHFLKMQEYTRHSIEIPRRRDIILLQLMGSQRVRHDRATDLIWSDWNIYLKIRRTIYINSNKNEKWSDLARKEGSQIKMGCSERDETKIAKFKILEAMCSLFVKV